MFYNTVDMDYDYNSLTWSLYSVSQSNFLLYVWFWFAAYVSSSPFDGGTFVWKQLTSANRNAVRGYPRLGLLTLHR